MTVSDFQERYLQPKENTWDEGYNTKNKPCDFLLENGDCLLGPYKPDNCSKYPYTDQPDRLGSLLSFLEIIKVCPVAFEICERLKDEYGFRR